MDELTRKKEALLGDIEILTQEIEFSMKEKDEEIRHLKEKCEASEDREKRQKKRLKGEIEAIR